MAHVRGCMVIKPWGYSLWEKMVAILDKEIKARGSENAYFPLFVPLRYIAEEAQHIKGFAKEMAVVTHHRLKTEKGRLVPSSPLPEPVVVRPTSETVIGHSFAKWITSYRDLPMKINQWCNVVRWEMRPRVFLRTSEFLWQEGHSAFATAEEALAETTDMIHMYAQFLQQTLCMPVFIGTKPPYDRFPGAQETYCVEAQMQDGKALQAGTSHHLGQNFSKAANILFSNKKGQQQHPFTTSWGVSTRLIGGLIMTHGDDDGLKIPPSITPLHAVIIPHLKEQNHHTLLNFAHTVRQSLQTASFQGNPINIKIDTKDTPFSHKKWAWIKKGVPLIIEIGPKEQDTHSLFVSPRPQEMKPLSLPLKEAPKTIETLLNNIQSQYFKQAKKYQKITKCQHFEDLKALFTSKIPGFVEAPYKPAQTQDTRLQDLGITIRCLPLKQEKKTQACILTGQSTTTTAIFAKSY